jgi:ABC-type phosphate transport system substrate-binding protein
MRAFRSGLALVCLSLTAMLAQGKQLAVVADTGNSTTNLSSAELAKIFNQHQRSWPDGKSITVVVRDPSCADMQLVLRKLFNMNADQARDFIQAHKGAIVVADSDDSILKFVSTNRGAIGIIDLYSLTKGVNVVKIDGKLPVEQGYLLRGN